MRFPVAWDDRGLLDDEPFRSVFNACSLADPGPRGRTQVRQCIKAVATEDLDKENGAVAAARQWTKLAFAKTALDDPDRNVSFTPATREVFVEFYWRMFQGQSPEIYLQQERRKRQFGYSLPPRQANPRRQANAKVITLGTSQHSKKPSISNGKRKRKATSAINRGKPDTAHDPESSKPIQDSQPHLTTAPKAEKDISYLDSNSFRGRKPRKRKVTMSTDRLPRRKRRGHPWSDNSSPSKEKTSGHRGCQLQTEESLAHNSQAVFSSGAKILYAVGAHTEPQIQDSSPSLNNVPPPGRASECHATLTSLPSVTFFPPSSKHGSPAEENVSPQMVSEAVEYLTSSDIDNAVAHRVSYPLPSRPSFPLGMTTPRVTSEDSYPCGSVPIDAYSSASSSEADSQVDDHISRKALSDAVSYLISPATGRFSKHQATQQSSSLSAGPDGPVSQNFIQGGYSSVCASGASKSVMPSERDTETEDHISEQMIVDSVGYLTSPAVSQAFDNYGLQRSLLACPSRSVMEYTIPALKYNLQNRHPQVLDLGLGTQQLSRNDDDAAVAGTNTSTCSDGCFPVPADAGFSQYKPPLPYFPPIWAQSRQEVCESLDSFKSYQGGVYYTHNMVKGYMLSAFSAKRDTFTENGRLIISHGGGKAECLHTTKGQASLQQADDQMEDDKSVRALVFNYRNRLPVVLLIDDKYALFPYDLAALRATYAVLGWYTIVHVWAEYQEANNERGRVIRYKFAFRWCEAQGEPWWLSAPHERQYFIDEHKSHGRRPEKVLKIRLSGHRPLQPDDIYRVCKCCRQKTPQVYHQGWACLNPTCRMFWITRQGFPLPPQLDYCSTFLRFAPTTTVPSLLQDICPPMPAPAAFTGAFMSYASTRGWHCRQCGRLSCRQRWEQWQCSHCKMSLRVLGEIFPARDLLSCRSMISAAHYVPESSGVERIGSSLFKSEHAFGRVQSFSLPHGRGYIHHIRVLGPSGHADADSIFKLYQEDALVGRLPFRRWPLRSHKCRGPLLTNYFSQNSGEVYHYVGGTENTTPFNCSPNAVLSALQLIQGRVKQALNAGYRFNEILSVAYMEQQRMAFHSDSETGLGPFVAGLSLGAPAIMHFRLRPKYRTPLDRSLIVLSLALQHGDVLVMDSLRVQEHYEHTVIPSNFRIAATARWIEPQHLFKSLKTEQSLIRLQHK